jgi:hypothetical protein
MTKPPPIVEVDGCRVVRDKEALSRTEARHSPDVAKAARAT